MAPGSYRLVVRTGPIPGTTIDLTKEVSVVGRDVTNDVVLGDSEVSRQHCRLTRTPGGYVLEDLGSTNGTFVNGERLASPRILNPGDLIGLGENISLVLESTEPEAAATVVAGARHPEPTRIPERAPEPWPTPTPRPEPTPPAPVQVTPIADEEQGGSRRWILAGCGCLVLIALCGGFIFFMDAYYPNILYAPLRMLGF